VESVKSAVHYVTREKGGSGAVREVVDLMLKTTGKWENILEELDKTEPAPSG
jgi:3-deoxy-D-manno-octulosonate 8-phosphate phosphatase (KDO 8-P phosphatase)